MEESSDKAGLRNAWGRVAGAYDEMWTARTARYTARGLDLAEPSADARGLDVACGPGQSALALADRLPRGSVLGVDFSAAMVERARARHGDRTGLSFAVDDAERLSLPDASFDVVTCSLGLIDVLLRPARSAPPDAGRGRPERRRG